MGYMRAKWPRLSMPHKTSYIYLAMTKPHAYKTFFMLIWALHETS